MSDNTERRFNDRVDAYTWEFVNEPDMRWPQLTVYSECCADTFSQTEMRALYDALDDYYTGLMH